MRDARRSFGLNLYAWALAACCFAAGSAAQALTQDLTSQFAITRSGPVLNRTTNTFDSTVTLKNSSDAPVVAPIDVVVGGLPAGITLSNKSGDEPDGRPYLSPMAAGSQLPGGASLTFVLKFANPARAAFTTTVQILRTVQVAANAPSLLGVVATGGTSAHLIGRVEGAANQDVTLQLTSASTCVAGTLVNGAAGATVTVRTDASGYFQTDVSGVNPGAFVSLKNAAAGSPLSPCQVAARDNDSWPKAFLLDGTVATARDFIDAPGKARWYKFAVLPGQRIDILLSGLPADYDLAAFKDIGQAFASQFDPATAGPGDLLKLTAEFAPSTFSPSTFSPSTFSPSTFSPDAYSPSTFSPSTFSPSVFSPSTFSPSTFSPSTFSPSTFSPSTFSPSTFSPSTFSPSTFSPSIYTLTEIAQAFSTAQMRSIVAISATPGLSDEATVVNTWNRTGFFYVRVTGRSGTFDTTTPFTLTVTKGVTTCAGITDTVLTPRPTVPASGLKTVLVTDSSKVALDAALTSEAGGTLRTKLAAFAARAEIQGVVVDVAGDGRVSALKKQAADNPACPFAKNLVAEEIKGIVDAYRANPLQYVVLVGNDDAIPFFRSPDQSVIGPESGYVPPVQSNSTSEASLRSNFVLSQDRYGSKTSIALPWNDFPVPGLAVGRLIETPGEIAGLIDAYTAAGAVVSPRTSLVTGYDFLEDAANAVKLELDTGTGAAGDALITPNGVSPQAPASWTADQLKTQLFGPHHDVIFLAGHFSANSALAADFSTSVLTTDLAASTTDFTNSIVFSAGCHAGYNLVDNDAIPGVTLPLDWAQAFARKQATLVAGTGYQYGDTDFLEYSERLYNNLARQLRAGPQGTPVAIGAALVQAKLAYLAATPDIRGLHEKALLEATLFGLPMLGVNMPAGRGEIPGTAPAIGPSPVASGPAATLGLQTFDLGVSPNLAPHTQVLTNLQGGPSVTANWLSGPDGVVAKPGEPALPLAVINVTPNDSHLVLRGIGYRGGSYVDSGPLVPFTGAATTESRGVHVPFLSPVFYPSTMWTPNYFGALAGNGGTQLLVSPVQYRAANITAGTSTQRRHSGMSLRLFYSGNLSQAALSDAPSIVAVDAQPDASGITFAAQVVGDPAAAIYQVWVTYTGDGVATWTSLDLAQCVTPLPAACGTSEDSRMWKGRLTGAPANLKYFVQAANGVGLVSRNDNVGAYFGIANALPTATTLVLLSPPSSAILGDSPTVTAKLTYAGGVALAGKTVAIGVGGASRFGVTGSDGTVAVKMPVVADPGNYLITAAFASDDVYQASSASAPLTINRAPVTPTVLPPSAGAAGVNIIGALGGTNAGLQQVPVAFTVNGPNGTTVVYSITDYLGNAIFPPPSGLPPGSYTITQATFGGSGTFAPTTITFPPGTQVSVPKLDQSIDFDALHDKTLGDPDFALFAAASSGLAVSYGASGACTVAGSTVHLTGTGSCTIDADQAGNTTYNAAARVTRSFSIAAGAAAPNVVSLVRASPNPTMADTVTYTATFSEAVTGVSLSNFSAIGLNGAIPTLVGGGGATWTITVNTGRGTGTLRLDVVNGTGITNGGGTPLAGTPFTGETYSIDKGGTVLGAGEGQPVAGFGNGAYALFGDVPFTTPPGRLRVLSNGQILAAGGMGCAVNVNPNAPGTAYCTLQFARYSASGVADGSFGLNGRVVTAVTNVTLDVNLNVLSDGSLIVRGSRYNGANDVPFAAKFTSTAAPDPSFGTNGVVTLNSLPLGFALIGGGTDGSGRIVIVGTTLDTGAGEREDIFVTRLTSTGATDTTFGTNGVAQFAISTVDNRSERGTTVDFQPDGKFVIGGRTKVTSGLGYDFLLMRLDDTGLRDPSFGVNGVVTTRFPGTTGPNLGRRLVLQPDGKIVLIGGVASSGATIDQCGVARFDGSGNLDPTFGTGGRVLLPVSLGCFDVSQQSDGKLVITGNDQVADVQYGTFIRLLPDGTPDASFGNAGFLDISNFDTPTRVAFTSTGNILTGLSIQDPADGAVKSYVVELSSTLAGPSLNQTIDFSALPDRAYGDSFSVSATASSGLAVSFSASGSCSIAFNLVQLTGLGSCTITASQAGDSTYLAAPFVQRTFAIAQANQVITFAPAPTGVTAEQLLVTIGATSTSPNAAPSANPIVFTSLTPSVCTWSTAFGGTVVPIAPGTCTIAANQAGNGFYNPAPQATLDIIVGAVVPPGNTYIVSNTNDSGAGSLRDAIAQANAAPGGNAVNLLGVTGTIFLTSGQIQISGPLIIHGPGADQLTISGSLNSRIFAMFATDPACPALDGSDYLVSISGLRLVNARRNVANSAGGAIFTEHSLALDSMVLEDNSALSGGGVQFSVQYPGQSLSISNSRFLNNKAVELVPAAVGATNGANGGALHVIERCQNATDTPHTSPVSVTIANSEFRNNAALPTGIYGRGGAIRSYARADIAITDTVIYNNQVEAPNPPVSGKTYYGGGFEGTARSLRIERSEIAGNDAFDATGADVTRSGGLHLYNSAVDLQAPGDRMAVRIVNSTISDNFSSATAGALVAFGNMSLEIDNSTVADNFAPSTRTGGIIMSQGDTYPVSGNNTARPTLTLVSSILGNNSSSGGDLAIAALLIPYTINASNSLIQKICFGGNCGTISVQGAGNLTSVGATLGPDPQLGVLAYHGGTTRTHSLLAGSPAINTGSNPFALTTDQRGAGFNRVTGGAADMGSYESGTPIPLSDFEYASKFGTSGTGNGQFTSPVGVAIDPTTHNIVVVDAVGNRVQIFDSTGLYISQFGTPGSGNGQFATPLIAAIDPTTHNIVVTDSGNRRVQIFTSAGVYVSQFGSNGSGNGQFAGPQGVAIDPVSHNIVVTDSGNQRVQVFTSTGAYVMQFGTPGTGDGQLSNPQGVAIDPTTRDIFVVDTGNHRVQAFDSFGEYIGQGGTLGTGNGQFQTPGGIAIDPTSHNIVVADSGNQRVQVFNSSGEYLSGFGAAGSGNGQFANPGSVAIDPTSHNILVSDIGNHRVQVFAPAGSVAPQQINGALDVPTTGSVISGTIWTSGWAFDTAGVTGVQMRLDGNVIGTAIRGIARPDIPIAFPGAPPDAGWEFVFNSTPYTTGPHTLSAVATDSVGTTRSFDAQITINQAQDVISPEGNLDLPVATGTVSGTIQVVGWAVDNVAISTVSILLDGIVIRTPALNIDRPDVQAAYPWAPLASGFEFALDTTLYANGAHLISAMAVDTSGHSVTHQAVITIANQAVASDYAYLSQFGSSGSGNGQFSSPWGVAIDATSRNIAVVDVSNGRVQIFDSAGTYLSQFGSLGVGDGQFGTAFGIAIDPISHNIFVVDSSSSRVQIFSSSGVFLGKFGTAGSGNGQFSTPTGIAVDPTSHNIVVVDSNNARVQIFDSTGNYLSQFGTLGFGNGQFIGPYNVAIDPTSRQIVVTDYGNSRVQIFSSSGVYVGQFGSPGLAAGQFNGPMAVAIDPSTHNIAVTDIGNSRVQIFDSNGAYLSQFGSAGTGNGQLTGAYGIAIDPTSHNVLVTDLGSNRVQIFTSSAGSVSTNYAYLNQFGSQGTGNGQFITPYGVAIDPTSRNILVTDNSRNRVQVFNSAGAYLSQFGTAGTGNGQFSIPGGIAIDPASHDIVVVDSGNNRVQIFSSAGVYLSQFGSAGTGDGQFNQPYMVAIDPISHNIVVVDGNNRRVQIFTSAGVFVSKFGTTGGGNGQFSVPFGVAVDPTSQNILVADFGNNRVQVFNSAGSYLSQFGASGTGNGQFNGAGGVAIDAANHRIFVTDYNNNRVQIFDSAGSYLAQFGASGTGNGQLNGSYGIAIDPASHSAVVTDVGNSRMQVFAPGSGLVSTNYAYLSQFGSAGVGNGQFGSPAGIAIDPTSHNIVVIDVNNARVQIFDPAGAYLSQFGSAGVGNGQFQVPSGVAIDPTSHNIVVVDSNLSRVQIFSSAGVYLSQFGTPGTGNGQFIQPYAVAIDPTSHNIVVTDVNNARVQIFDSAGVYLSQFGTPGTGNGQFSGPYGVAIDSTSHEIFVTDNFNANVQIFSSTGAYLGRFGSAGTGNGQFTNAFGVAIDPTSHNIVVSEVSNHRVQIFSPAGVYLDQFGSGGVGNGQFLNPYAIAIDPTSHNIVVSDYGSSRVQIFAPQ